VRVAQPRHLLEEPCEWCEGARDHGVEGSLDRERLDPRVERRDVGELKERHGVRYEADLLARRVDEREVPLRITQGERQPWKSGSGADVGDALARKIGAHGKAVEQVMRDHRLERGNRGEVVTPVPALELFEQPLQRLGLLFRQSHSEIRRILDEARAVTGAKSTQGSSASAGTGANFGACNGSVPGVRRPGVSGRAIDHTLPTVRLLLVEDDPMIGEAIRAGLKREGFTVDWVHDASAAAGVLRNEPFELMLLDLGLPGADGLQLLKALRGRGEGLPVIILTARDAVSDRVRGLDAGADDYLTKPFDLDELAARIRALLRRKAGRSSSALEHLGVVLDPAEHRVIQNGVEVALSPREFAVLQLLLERPGAILSRAQIEERLYGWGEEVESNAVEVHVHGLRRKLGAQFILTVRGVGYRVRPAA
jgi:two-component system, OmpR family, response regulator QseB